MANWLCQKPARLAGIEKRKGSITVGCDADFVIWNPDATFTVDPERLHHRHKITPYAGRELHGVVETTFLRGRPVYRPRRIPFASSWTGLAARQAVTDFTKLVDLASERLGGRAIEANDEFFAPKSNLLKARETRFYRRQIHLPRQMDGRLGNAPPPHSGLRLVHHPAWACPESFAESSWTPAISKEISRRDFRSRPSIWAVAAPYANERARLKKAEQEWVRAFSRNASRR